jgi:hypothetical protein
MLFFLIPKDLVEKSGRINQRGESFLWVAVLSEGAGGGKMKKYFKGAFFKAFL